MAKILIDLDSIKENPNAGRCRTVLLGEWTGYCKIDVWEPGVLCLPPGCIAISELKVNDGILDPHTQYEVNIGNWEAYEALRNNKNVTDISISREPYIIEHMPEQKYHFQYENTKVTCSSCSTPIPVNKIITEEVDAGSKCGPHIIEIKICPLCDSHGSFDYEYESIDGAIKRKNKRDKTTPFKVIEYEHDSWSGKSVFGIKYYHDEQSARQEANRVNSKNTLDSVPETYYTAEVIINKEWAQSILEQDPGYWDATT